MLVEKTVIVELGESRPRATDYDPAAGFESPNWSNEIELHIYTVIS